MEKEQKKAMMVQVTTVVVAVVFSTSQSREGCINETMRSCKLLCMLPLTPKQGCSTCIYYGVSTTYNNLVGSNENGLVHRMGTVLYCYVFANSSFFTSRRDWPLGGTPAATIALP